MRTILVATACAALGGCTTPYGNPQDQARRNADRSTYDLCSNINGALLAAESVRDAWRAEVARRGETCANFRTPTTAEQLRQIQSDLDSTQRRPLPSEPAARAFGPLKTQYVSGFNRVCIYTTTAGDAATTIASTSICPSMGP